MTDPNPSSPYTPRPPAGADLPSRPSFPTLRPAGGVPFIGQMAIGFGLTLFALTATTILTALFFTGDVFLPAVLFAGLIVILVGLSIAAWIGWRWRGFPAGVLSALLGIALLIAAAAFLIYSICSGM